MGILGPLVAMGILYVVLSKGLLDNLFKPGPTTPPPAGGGGGGTLPPGTPFHFSTAGDFRDNTETAANLAANNPAIIPLLGDYSYNGGAQEWWTSNMAAINGMKVIGTKGNHDDPFDEFLALWPENGGKWEFVYKVSNVAFVAFDTEENNPSTLDPLMQQAQDDPTVAHIIPFAHKTIFTPEPGNSLKPDADAGYFDIIKKYDKVRMVLGGHNHFYARMSAVPGTGFIYVTVGNGGANPHPDSDDSGPGQYIRANGCLHCDVNNESISCRMITNQGSTYDEFTITPGNPPTSSQTPGQAPTGGDGEADNDSDATATYARAMLAYRARIAPSGRYTKVKSRRRR